MFHRSTTLPNSSPGGPPLDTPRDDDHTPELIVADEPRPHADSQWSRGARAGLLGAVALLALLTFMRVWWPAAAARPRFTVAAPSTEDRMRDLATGCVRDATNYDAATMTVDAFEQRLARCYTLTPALLSGVWDGSGAQVAAEPTPFLTRRTPDGWTATWVIRERVTGPHFAYYTVDVGCRPSDGACSLTTVPTLVKDIEGNKP